MDSRLSICSLNCRGLGDAQKRRDMFHYLRGQNFSFYFLQDTHFHPSTENRIRAEWGNDIYFASFTSNSRGVAILVNDNIEYKVIEVLRDINGNFLILHIKAFEREFLLVNIYGPNNDSPDFFSALQETISNVGLTENLIIAGDWNLVQNFNIDCKNYVRQNNLEASRQVKEMIESLELTDIWRNLNPGVNRFTWRRPTPLQQSRLDYFLISDLLAPVVVETDIKIGYRTDHSLVTLTLQFEKDFNRNQFWKFNSSLLSDFKYVKDINNLIEETIAEFAVYPYDRNSIKDIPLEELVFTISDQILLDFLLMKIRNRTINYASQKKKAFEQSEKKLINDIEVLEKLEELTETDKIQLQNKRDELTSIRDIKMKGVLIRSRARWVEEGEKVSAYFCNLEKRNYINKSMNRLVTSEGSIISDKTEIINEVKEFYETLYKKREVEDTEINNLVRNIPKLDEPRSRQLEGPLTLEEISSSLKNMSNGKSPGSDGFTSEFFKCFWRRLGPLVLRSLNEGFLKGELSSSQKEGVIICIPKTEENRDILKNWRPISLLNITYKIGSASIADRLKTVLPQLISSDQSGFIKNRFIGDNIRLIYDIIDHLTSSNLPGLLLILDFEKAFDSLDWNFMQKTLRAFGFGIDMCKWISLFFNNIKSTVSVNGQLSNWFNIFRGCRQGDPISPYLFILCVEIMGIMIRENNEIKGIVINDIENKITQYADDSEILLNGDRKSFEETFRTIETFSKASGLKLNVNKTNAVWLGSRQNSPIRFMPHLDVRWNPVRFKILGIWFTNDLVDCFELNYNDKFLEIRKLYLIWLKRNLTPLGRIAILKSLILSKLIFLWILLPNPPDDIVNKIQASVFEFIWNSKTDRISRKTSIKSLDSGGLGIPSIKHYIQALKLTWVRRLHTSDHKWKDIFISKFPNCKTLENFGGDFSNNAFNMFWRDVFLAYNCFAQKLKVEESEDFLAEPLFLNMNILVDKKPILYENWVAKGVLCIGDLIKETGEFLSYIDFNRKFDIQGNNFLQYMGCVAAIRAYKQKLNALFDLTSTRSERNLLTKTIFSIFKGSKLYYDVLLGKENIPKYCQKWTEKLNVEVNWKKVYEIICNIREIKLKWFQIRLMTRILGTNIVLFGMNIRNDDICSFCNEERETIEHLFSECNVIWNLLNAFKSKLIELNIVDRSFRFDDVMLLFGFVNERQDTSFEYVMSVLRYYIYKCRCEGSFPSLGAFQTYLSHKLKVEKYIALKNNDIEKFDKKWVKWINFLTM